MYTPATVRFFAAARGFTLLELLAALTIAGLVLAVSIPSGLRLYDGMQYRGAVRDAVSLLSSARYTATRTGYAQDVEVDPRRNELRFNDTLKQLPDSLRIAVSSSRELNREERGVIRFYPEGGSSGGDLDIERAQGSGVRIKVDWLAGRITQEPYDG